MKKLSFLELEREMEVLSRDEAFRTKGGHPPYDCFFQSLGYIIGDKWNDTQISEQGVENSFNVYMDPNKNDNKVPDLADDGVTIGEGQGWGNMYIGNQFNGGCVSYTSGTAGIPNTTFDGGIDQYMLVVPGGNGMDHDVVFEHVNANGSIQCWDAQLGQSIVVSSNTVIGTYEVHRDGGPTTTMPTTTVPTTTVPHP